MGRVVIASLDEARDEPFPILHGIKAAGSIASRPVIKGSDRPLLMWRHELPAGASIVLEAPPIGHVIYVLSGTARANDSDLEADDVLIVEHKGSATIEAGDSGAKLLHFHRNEGLPEEISRAGGNVHVLAKDVAFRQANANGSATMTVWLGSDCPTCELWLHRRDAPVPGPQGKRHFHDVDEIIYVIGGGLKLGRRILSPGTALAIDANTIYAFSVPEEGLSFLNFRTKEPATVMVGPNNEPLNEPVKGAERVRERFATERHSESRD